MSIADTRVLILLNDVSRADSLCQALVAMGQAASVAGSSDHLYALLVGAGADLLVIGQRLGGFISGLEIIERLQANLTQPDVVLVGSLSPVEAEQARKLGVASRVGDSASADELLSAVEGRIAQVKASSSGIPPKALRLAAFAEVVQPMPQLLVKLCTYLQDDTVSLTALATDLSTDARVTAELLKLTNAAASGLSRKITSVQEAVVLLGRRRTIATVLEAGVFRAQSQLLNALPHAIREWYQTRSILTATTAAAFARRMENISGETAHVLGLFQDLGALLLAKADPRAYERVLQRIRMAGQVRLENTEFEEFGVTHAEVSAALLHSWSVPNSLVTLVLDHHPREHGGEHAGMEERFIHVMRIGEAVANLTQFQNPHRHRTLSVLLQRYGQRKEECLTSIAEGAALAKEHAELFSMPVPDADAVQQMLEELTTSGPPDDSAGQIFQEQLELHVADHRTPDEATPLSAERRLRVLAIDDHELILSALSTNLERDGFDVVRCADGRRAVSSADGVDLVLCDVHLEDVPGLDVVRSLKASGVAVPILMISGDHSRSTVTECISAGISDYIVKPFDWGSLAKKLRHHIARHRSAMSSQVAVDESTNHSSGVGSAGG